jgi:hypothetical protein
MYSVLPKVNMAIVLLLRDVQYARSMIAAQRNAATNMPPPPPSPSSPAPDDVVPRVMSPDLHLVSIVHNTSPVVTFTSTSSLQQHATASLSPPHVAATTLSALPRVSSTSAMVRAVSESAIVSPGVPRRASVSALAAARSESASDIALSPSRVRRVLARGASRGGLDLSGSMGAGSDSNFASNLQLMPADDRVLSELNALGERVVALSVEALGNNDLFRGMVGEMRALRARVTSPLAVQLVAQLLFIYSPLAQLLDVLRSDGASVDALPPPPLEIASWPADEYDSAGSETEGAHSDPVAIPHAASAKLSDEPPRPMRSSSSSSATRCVLCQVLVWRRRWQQHESVCARINSVETRCLVSCGVSGSRDVGDAHT